MASWLVCSTSERVVRVRALAGDIVLCSWGRHFTLTVPLSTQVYKWVPANCWGNLTNCGEVTCDGLASRPGEVEILLAASCYRNRDKHRQLWASLGSKASLLVLPVDMEFLFECSTWDIELNSGREILYLRVPIMYYPLYACVCYYRILMYILRQLAIDVHTSLWRSRPLETGARIILFMNIKNTYTHTYIIFT